MVERGLAVVFGDGLVGGWLAIGWSGRTGGGATTEDFFVEDRLEVGGTDVPEDAAVQLPHEAGAGDEVEGEAAAVGGDAELLAHAGEGGGEEGAQTVGGAGPLQAALAVELGLEERVVEAPRPAP